MNPQFYVTRWNGKCTTYCKIKQSLRSHHFGCDYEKALAFFDSLDDSYRANLKKFEEGVVSILRSK